MTVVRGMDEKEMEEEEMEDEEEAQRMVRSYMCACVCVYAIGCTALFIHFVSSVCVCVCGFIRFPAVRACECVLAVD